MPPEDRIPVWLRILLPCLLVAVLGLQPAALQIRQAWDLVRLAEETGSPGQAALQLRHLLEIEPWRVDLWEPIGMKELSAGALPRAIEALQTAARLGALSSDGRLALGDAYAQSNDVPSAVREWRALGTAPALEKAVRALWDGESENELRSVLGQWSRLEPQNGLVRYRQGLLMLPVNDQNAVQVLLEAGRLDPRISPEVEILRRAVGLAGQSDNAAYRALVIGRALGSVGEWTLARRMFLAAIETAPGYAEAHAFLSEAEQQLGRDGAPELQKAGKLAPESVVVQALSSVYWRRQGEPKRALAALQRVIQAEPDEAIWQAEAGATMAASGDLIAALPYYQKAVEMEPGNPEWWAALAHFSVDYSVDLTHVGLPAARQALQLAPNDPTILDLMGQVFLKLNDLASAERFLQRALQIDRSLAAAHLHLGQVYIQWERPGPALESLTTASRLGANSEVGSLARRLLKQFFPGNE